MAVLDEIMAQLLDDDFTILRAGKPVAVLISYDRYRELLDAVGPTDTELNEWEDSRNPKPLGFQPDQVVDITKHNTAHAVLTDQLDRIDSWWCEMPHTGPAELPVRRETWAESGARQPPAGWPSWPCQTCASRLWEQRCREAAERLTEMLKPLQGAAGVTYAVSAPAVISSDFPPMLVVRAVAAGFGVTSKVSPEMVEDASLGTASALAEPLVRRLNEMTQPKAAE